MPEPITVLVVDDDAALRELAASVLTLSGYAVATAPDGPAALDWIADHCADVLLCDLRMWPLDGVTLLEAIRDRWGHVPPAVIMTAYLAEGGTQNVRQAIARVAHPVEILTKPFELHELDAAIRAVLAPS